MSGSVVLITLSRSLLDLVFPSCSQPFQWPKFKPSGFLLLVFCHLYPMCCHGLVIPNAYTLVQIKAFHQSQSLLCCLILCIITTRNYGHTCVLPSLSYIAMISTSGLLFILFPLWHLWKQSFPSYLGVLFLMLYPEKWKILVYWTI